MNPLKYVRETWTELQLVRWPTRSTVVKLTTIVIIISTLVGLYVGGLDYGLTSLLKYLVG